MAVKAYIPLRRILKNINGLSNCMEHNSTNFSLYFLVFCVDDIASKTVYVYTLLVSMFDFVLVSLSVFL